jgi:hypothetical protein
MLPKEPRILHSPGVSIALGDNASITSHLVVFASPPHCGWGRGPKAMLFLPDALLRFVVAHLMESPDQTGALASLALMCRRMM